MRFVKLETNSGNSVVINVDRVLAVYKLKYLVCDKVAFEVVMAEKVRYYIDDVQVDLLYGRMESLYY